MRCHPRTLLNLRSTQAEMSSLPAAYLLCLLAHLPTLNPCTILFSVIAETFQILLDDPNRNQTLTAFKIWLKIYVFTLGVKKEFVKQECRPGNCAVQTFSRLTKTVTFLSFAYSSELWGILKMHTHICSMNTHIA